MIPAVRASNETSTKALANGRGPVTVVAGKGTEELPSCGARGAWGEGREGGGGATYRKNCPEAVARRSVL